MMGGEKRRWSGGKQLLIAGWERLRRGRLSRRLGVMSISSASEDETSEAGEEECPVSEEWLEAMLSSHHEGHNVKVSEFSVRPGCDQGESVLSDILAVDVDYTLEPDNEERALSLIIKLLPQDPFSRFFVTEAQFDLREIKFYTKVFERFIYFS